MTELASQSTAVFPGIESADSKTANNNEVNNGAPTTSSQSENLTEIHAETSSLPESESAAVNKSEFSGAPNMSPSLLESESNAKSDCEMEEFKDLYMLAKVNNLDGSFDVDGESLKKNEDNDGIYYNY